MTRVSSESGGEVRREREVGEQGGVDSRVPLDEAGPVVVAERGVELVDGEDESAGVVEEVPEGLVGDDGLVERDLVEDEKVADGEGEGVAGDVEFDVSAAGPVREVADDDLDGAGGLPPDVVGPPSPAVDGPLVRRDRDLSRPGRAAQRVPRASAKLIPRAGLEAPRRRGPAVDLDRDRVRLVARRDLERVRRPAALLPAAPGQRDRVGRAFQLRRPRGEGRLDVGPLPEDSPHRRGEEPGAEPIQGTLLREPDELAHLAAEQGEAHQALEEGVADEEGEGVEHQGPQASLIIEPHRLLATQAASSRASWETVPPRGGRRRR
mmetsp:Transcript_23613/g.73884  ORF Transcript_23613/g.73884 Transcript_23613/m.73884 type:complete len:322 (-) Transcript_23613:15-980(-)